MDRGTQDQGERSMKFFKRFVKQDNPKSQEFVDAIKKILDDHGVKDKRSQNECSQALFKANIVLMKAIGRGEDVNANIAAQTDKMKEVLSKHGITAKELQEEIILDYFCTLGELAGANDVPE